MTTKEAIEHLEKLKRNYKFMNKHEYKESRAKKIKELEKEIEALKKD